MRRTSTALSPVLAFLLFSAASLAQTTGSIVGTVSDDTGAPLPGATVEARGPALQGTKIVATATDGSFRLALLPPGSYTVSASLPQFGRAEQTVQVLLDRNVTADFRLRATAREEVVVSGEVPVVDPTTPTIGANISQRAIQNLPTERNYSSVVQIVPGVSTDASNNNIDQATITVYGSSGAENAYLIDGVNTTNVEYGLQGKELNFEFIQEVDVKTGGYEAEYGRSTGGIVNVITKSGGNEFHGDLFGYYDDDSLQADRKRVGETLQGTALGFTRDDWGADVGGYILKDRLWFFAAYDRVTHKVQNALTAGPFEGEEVESKSVRNLGSGKLTWGFTPGHTLVASFIQDPRTDSGAINDANHTLNGEFSTFLGRQDYGGRDYSLRWDGLFGSSLAVSAQGARHDERNSIGPSTADGDTVEYIDTRVDNFQTGGFGLIQKKNFERDHFLVSATGFLRSHEIKGGVEYETDSAEVTKRMSGGQQVTIFENPANAARPIYQHFYWTIPNATDDPFNAPLSQLNASPEHEIWTAYLQDRWNVLPELTLNLGVRWDRQEIIDASGVTRITLDQDFAPRLGVIWNPGRDKKTKVFGSFGFYYEEIPMDLVIRSFSFERQPRVNNFDPTGIVPDPQADAILDSPSGIFGGFTEPTDPDLENQYVREILVGAEREVIPDLAVGLKYIYRDYGQVIEDFLCVDDGTYCIGNPGEGIMREVFTLDYATTFPAPDPKRIFRGVQLDVTKRFSNNWQAIASYLWSKLEGNYDGEVAPFTNVGPDPNISAAYDYYDFFTDGQHRDEITNRGPLSNDRRHQFKISAVWVTDFRLSLGVSAYYRTGTPVTRYGFSDAYGRYEFFLTRRGAEGRTPDNYEADVHVGYPLHIGPVTVNLLADVFNLLNVQRPILLDQRYNFAEFADADYVCGSNSSAVDEPKCNERYGQAFLRQAPRSLRLGARISF
ncbi:MAG TPA: TonB-dependent receptor [Thermoanaerobaculia bacterium]|nr:TonB-dependent receptor [Thermoanaerobaculia bacterium]